MVLIRRSLVAALLAAVISVLGLGFTAGSAGATARPHSSSAAATQAPCGRKHYPPCPPKHKIGHQDKTKVKQGHSFHIYAKHFRPHARVMVRIEGHGHDRLLYSAKLNKHGSDHFEVVIPRNFKPGRYNLTVKVGSTTKTISIHVKKRHHHHHHHH